MSNGKCQFTHQQWEDFYESERQFEEKWSGVLILNCPDCGERLDVCYCPNDDEPQDTSGYYERAND